MPRTSSGGAAVLPAPWTPADAVEFIDAMVAHHQMATEMAEEELARGADGEVVAMAAQMQETQAAEVERLLARRDALTTEPVHALEEDPHAEEALAELASRSGESLDRAFLVEMIVHHADAVSIAHRAGPNLDDSEVAAIAETIEDAQAWEIGQMRQRLDVLEGLVP
ncbi:MAG: DUF305 domain-containing protein [Myxococcota bacterium]